MAQQLRVGILQTPQHRALRKTVLLAGGDFGLLRGSSHIVVQNISESGMLVLADPPLSIGDTLSLRLADCQECIARVVRQDQHFSGCHFDAPIPKSWISAASLRSPFPGSSPSIGNTAENALPQARGHKDRIQDAVWWIGGLGGLGWIAMGVIGLLGAQALSAGVVLL